MAILAREHGVPTVVGHAGATTTYREGQRLEVDGAAGAVRAADGDRQPTATPEPGGAERPANVPVAIPVAMPVEIGA